MLFAIEPISPEQADVQVYLIVSSAIRALEGVRV